MEIRVAWPAGPGVQNTVSELFWDASKDRVLLFTWHYIGSSNSTERLCAWKLAGDSWQLIAHVEHREAAKWIEASVDDTHGTKLVILGTKSIWSFKDDKLTRVGSASREELAAVKDRTYEELELGGTRLYGPSSCVDQSTGETIFCGRGNESQLMFWRSKDDNMSKAKSFALPIGSFGGIFVWSPRGLLRPHKDLRVVYRWDGERFTEVSSPMSKGPFAGNASLAFAVDMDGTLYGENGAGTVFRLEGGEWQACGDAPAKVEEGTIGVTPMGPVLFGGRGGPKNQPQKNTYVYDGASWRQVDGKRPDGRTGAKTLTLPEGMLLWGGMGRGYKDCKDAWFFDGTAWTKQEEGLAAMWGWMFYDYQTGVICDVCRELPYPNIALRAWQGKEWKNLLLLPPFPPCHLDERMDIAASWIGYDAIRRVLVFQATVSTGRVMEIPLGDALNGQPPFEAKRGRTSKARVKEPKRKLVARRKKSTPVYDAWQRIEVYLSERLPEVLETFKPGATEKQLARLEKEIGCTLPGPLKEHLSCHNGSDSGYFIDGRWELCSTANAAKEWKTNCKVGLEMDDRDFWKDTWIPLASDGAGNFLCLDAQTGTVIQADNDPYERQQLHPDLARWLSIIAKDLESGSYD